MKEGASQPAGTHALIVDDEVLMRTVLREMLEESGYGVIEAASREEALQLVRQNPPDVVLLDIVIPGHQGAKPRLSHLQSRNRRENRRRYSQPVLSGL